MSQKLISVKVTCRNPNCNFSAIYNQTTLEQIKEHREFWSKIPVCDFECPHTDVTLTEVPN